MAVRVARLSEWTDGPPSPESAGEGQDEACGRCGSPERVDGQSTLPRKRWEGPESVKSRVARLSEWMDDPPFPENAGKGQEEVKANGLLLDSPKRVDQRSTLPRKRWEGPESVNSRVACLSKWINDPPFPENAGKGLEMWPSEWLA